jgi:hypothetical protein
MASMYPCGVDRIQAYRTALAFAENCKDFVMVFLLLVIIGGRCAKES